MTERCEFIWVNICEFKSLSRQQTFYCHRIETHSLYTMVLFSRVAQLGGHTIYKVMDTCMVPIPNETVRTKYHHDGESKLVFKIVLNLLSDVNI